MTADERIADIVELWREVDIVRLIGDETPLEPSPVGDSWLGPCPFCATDDGERVATFVVDPHRRIWQCFSCGEGGSPFSFLMKKHQWSFLKAMDWVRAVNAAGA